MPEAQASIYVGIDVSKDKLAVAIASGERRDEVLSLGTFENTPVSVDKLLKKLSGRGNVSVCYEAGRMRRLRPIDFARFRWVMRLREGLL